MQHHRFIQSFVCAVLCLAILLAFPLTVSAKPTALLIARQWSAPVYYGASSDSACIGYLLPDTALTVLEQQGKYYRIDCYDMTGYLHEDFVKSIDGEYYVSSQPFHPDAKGFVEKPFRESIILRCRLYNLAVAQVGVPYVSGGTSPRGFDCSGFTQYIYSQLGISIPRSCDSQLGFGIIIPKEQLQCGDLVLFQRTTSQRGLSTHVGIYLGDGKLIHAGSKGITIVELDSAYFTKHYLCARRIILSDRPEVSALGVMASLERAG